MSAENSFYDLRDNALAWHVKRGGSKPRSAAVMVKILARYLKLRGEVWVPGDLTAMSKHPEFNAMWRTVRLCCQNCDGYYVVRHRLGRAYKIAGCSNYRDTGCRSTMGSKEYTRAKGDVVLAVLLGQPSPRPYLIAERHPSSSTHAGGKQAADAIP